MRLSLLDWVGTTLAGSPLPPATQLNLGLFPLRGEGRAICFVDGLSGSPRHAALLNGTASHIVEFDDIFKDGGYHPGSPTIAAALAMAQQVDAPLDLLHRAIVAGYEVGCRISLAVQPSHYRHWHTTSTVGTIGAAVAASMLIGADVDEMAQSIAIATSFAGGHQQNLQGEGTVKALHAGHAAEAGVLAAYAARGGVTASLDSLHAEFGFARATSISTGDWDKALDGLGDWTPITRMTTKYHGCCGHIFPALDGMIHLMATHGLSATDLASIHVEGYEATRNMCDRLAVVTPRDARFSVQYCVAALLVTGRVRLEAFEPKALADPRLRAIMPTITVSEDPELSLLYPERRMARLRVKLGDGRRLEHLQPTRRGDPDDPLSEQEMLDKFRELAGSRVPREAAERMASQILQGDHIFHIDPGWLDQ